MKEKEKNPILETADQNMKSYEQTLRTGLKLQEEAWQSWYAMLNQSQFGPKRFNNVTGATNTVVPAVQKGLVETVDLMGKNALLGAELMKKALASAAGGPRSNSEPDRAL